jgi:integration host factor subunit beta
LSNAVAEATVTEIFNSRADALLSGNGVEIRGFGSFSIRKYDGHNGRNPKSGAVVEVKPKKTHSSR